MSGSYNPSPLTPGDRGLRVRRMTVAEETDYVHHGEGRITRYEYGNGSGRVTVSLDGGVWTIEWRGYDGMPEQKLQVASKPDRGEGARKLAQEMTRIVEHVVYAHDQARARDRELEQWVRKATEA